ncbi:hypothetical protein [Microcystis aeruginosa]|uniref:hypothetical protein n=1 Tax=Microcystis aeruginosa TaxID=1126 RepID=UPI000A52B6DF|nr:hypothetical protein [Microcystis aeruginosa]BCU11143.1 hypothetical protein MAN88_17070 [Microcystis aeruginosa]
MIRGKIREKSQVQNRTQISILSDKSVSKNSQNKKPRTIIRKVRRFSKKTPRKFGNAELGGDDNDE